MNSTTDAGDLSRLHDIVLPPTPSWWPPAPGWYVLAAVLLGWLAFGAVSWLNWLRRTRYRREALRELQLLESSPHQPGCSEQLAALVKRVALVVYPRERVAALTGKDWLMFLDASAGMNEFANGDGRQLEAFYARDQQAPQPALFAAVKHWIEHHRPDYSC